MIRNSPRNTPKMPRNRPPPLPQKTQSADAIEVVKKLQALTTPSPNSSPVTPAAAATTSSVVVSGRKPPTPTHTAALSAKKKRTPRSLSTGEKSPRIMEGVKLRESKESICIVQQSELGNQCENVLPYSRKIWRGIKFGGLAVFTTTAKLKSAKISYSHIYIWRSRTEPPNLNPQIFLQ